MARESARSAHQNAAFPGALRLGDMPTGQGCCLLCLFCSLADPSFEDSGTWQMFQCLLNKLIAQTMYSWPRMLHIQQRVLLVCLGQANRKGCPGRRALQGPEVWVGGSREVSGAFAWAGLVPSLSRLSAWLVDTEAGAGL